MSHEDILPEEAELNSEELEFQTAEDTNPAPSDQLAGELANATRLAEENWDKFIRTQAELENLKRRSEKDLQNAHKFGLEKFARELLPVADSLELGLSVETGDNPDVQKLREGMELTLKQLLASLEKLQRDAHRSRG